MLIAAFEIARVLSGGDACDEPARALPASDDPRPGAAWTLHSRAGAAPAGDMAMPETYELHFQEGFTGETVEILVDGAGVARFEARTRMQIGLAHIERLDLAPGAVVTIRLANKSTSSSITTETAKDFININLKDNNIILDAAESSPGYL